MADEKSDKKIFAKPLPRLDEEIRPWWEALKRHELYIQKCRDCGDLRYYPRALCTNCLSFAVPSGCDCWRQGKIYTFTATIRTRRRAFANRCPM